MSGPLAKKKSNRLRFKAPAPSTSLPGPKPAEDGGEAKRGGQEREEDERRRMQSRRLRRSSPDRSRSPDRRERERERERERGSRDGHVRDRRSPEREGGVERDRDGGQYRHSDRHSDRYGGRGGDRDRDRDRDQNRDRDREKPRGSGRDDQYSQRHGQEERARPRPGMAAAGAAAARPLTFIIVTVNDRLGTKTQIPCLPSDSIGDFKKLLAARIGRPPHEIMLKRQGERPFKDALSLEDYSISNGVQIDLELDTGD